MRPRLLGIALASCLALATGAARADDPEPDAPKERYFYKGYDYGSQALFGPGYVILNRGYDVMQLRPGARNIFTFDYGKNLGNVLRSVRDPIGTVSRSEPRWQFLREEILPLSWTATTARWVPNYGLHLIGGGATYRELREWFEDHDVPGATAFSIATLYAAAFINEAVENNGTIGPNTDCLADLYVFDSLGIILFSFDFAADFFSRVVRVMDWSLQPAFVFPTLELHNQGNYYAIKAPLPFVDRLRLFGYIGTVSMGGLSYRVAGEYSVSVAAGGRVVQLQNAAAGKVENVITMHPSLAAFIDRNDSLLAQVQVTDADYYTVSANLYPNAIVHTDPGVGLWTAVNRDGRFLVGVSITGAIGYGLGVGTF